MSSKKKRIKLQAIKVFNKNLETKNSLGKSEKKAIKDMGQTNLNLAGVKK